MGDRLRLGFVTSIVFLLGVFVLAVVSIGCVKAVTIVPIDDAHNVLSAARVRADGRDVGVGVTRVEVRQGAAQVTVSAGPDWIEASRRLDDLSPDRIEVMLAPNELFRSTVEDTNRVVNQFMSVSIALWRHDTWWTSVVAAITGADFEVEIMDAASGFLRTAWRETNFGPLAGRRRITGNIVTHDPLVWRFRYEVQHREADSQDWHDYDRGFADDLRVLSEIRGRTEQ